MKRLTTKCEIVLYRQPVRDLVLWQPKVNAMVPWVPQVRTVPPNVVPEPPAQEYRLLRSVLQRFATHRARTEQFARVQQQNAVVRYQQPAVAQPTAFIAPRSHATEPPFPFLGFNSSWSHTAPGRGRSHAAPSGARGPGRRGGRGGGRGGASSTDTVPPEPHTGGHESSAADLFAWFRYTLVAAALLLLGAKALEGELDYAAFMRGAKAGLLEKLEIIPNATAIWEADDHELPAGEMRNAVEMVLAINRRIPEFKYAFLFDSAALPGMLRGVVLTPDGSFNPYTTKALRELIQAAIELDVSPHSVATTSMDATRRYVLGKYGTLASTLDRCGVLDGVIGLAAWWSSPMARIERSAQQLSAHLVQEQFDLKLTQLARQHSSYAAGYISGGLMPGAVIGIAARLVGLHPAAAFGFALTLGAFTWYGGFKQSERELAVVLRQRGFKQEATRRFSRELALIGIDAKNIESYRTKFLDMLSADPTLRADPALAGALVDRGLAVMLLCLEKERNRLLPRAAANTTRTGDYTELLWPL